MPGSVGPMDKATLSACGKRSDRVGQGDGANAIFYLDARHVCLDRAGGQLYFVDNPQGTIVSIINEEVTRNGCRPVVRAIAPGRTRPVRRRTHGRAVGRTG